MIAKIYSVYDRKSVSYSDPFVSVNDECAMRSVSSALIRSGSIMADHPEDFDLYVIGTFDDQTATLEHWISRICCVADLKRKESSPDE